RLTIDVASPSTLDVATSTNGVFKSTDGGATWGNTNNALSQSSISALTIDKGAAARTLYAASSVRQSFVTKFNSSGSIAYCTYLGGHRFQDSGGIAVDGQGNAYVVGSTSSMDFPTVNALQSSPPLPSFDVETGFVSKISPNGSSLVYSTYLGSSLGFDTNPTGIAVDSQGSAYVTGSTFAPDFPVTLGAFQTVNRRANAFVTEFAPSGNC